jgi:hypothetical protein
MPRETEQEASISNHRLIDLKGLTLMPGLALAKTGIYSQGDFDRRLRPVLGISVGLSDANAKRLAFGPEVAEKAVTICRA